MARPANRGQVQGFGDRYETQSEMIEPLKGCQQVRRGPAPAV